MNPEAAANSSRIVVTPLEFRGFPDQSRLFSDFLYAETSAINRFWPNRDLSTNEFVEQVVSGYQTDRDLLCDALLPENEIYGAGPETIENIERLRQPDCVAVVTGQQSGLFTGPAYTVYKALSAIKTAAKLRETGMNAVPVFWIASEDHDFDEISHVNFRNRNNSLAGLRIPRNKAFEGFPVGRIPIGSEIDKIVNSFFDEIQSSSFTSVLKSEISESYNQNTDFSTAFGILMTSWLGKYGLVFTNPLNPAIRKLSAPIFAKAVESYDVIRSGLMGANNELIEAGYHAQVVVEEDYFPLFYISEKGRRSAMRDSGGIVRSKDGLLECPISKLAERVNANPDSFSPNALFRPIVQDFVFPTVCYVGGAAEIAYFAQNVSVYKALGRAITPIRHRAAVTILDARHRRTLEAYGLSVSDLWLGYEKVLERLISERAEPETRQKLKETGMAISQQLLALNESVADLDRGLHDNFEKRHKKILWHIQAMEGKLMHFEERRNGDMVRRMKDLFDSGFPKGGPQERTICFADHLNRYGPRLLDWLYEHVDETGHEHRVVSL